MSEDPTAGAGAPAQSSKAFNKRVDTMLKCATKLIKDYPHCRAALVVQSPYNSSGSGKKWRRPFLYGFGDDPQQQELLASLAVHIASCEGRSVDWRLGWAAAAAGLTVEELAKFRSLLAEQSHGHVGREGCRGL